MSDTRKEQELQRYRLFHRIKTASMIDNDGIEFLEYLHTLKANTVDIWMSGKDDYEDKIHKGFVLALDKLIENFEECEGKIDKLVKNQKEFDFTDAETQVWDTEEGDQ